MSTIHPGTPGETPGNTASAPSAPPAPAPMPSPEAAEHPDRNVIGIIALVCAVAGFIFA